MFREFVDQHLKSAKPATMPGLSRDLFGLPGALNRRAEDDRPKSMIERIHKT